MRIFLAEDKFERAGMQVAGPRRLAKAAEGAGPPVDALISRPREFLNPERMGAPNLGVRGARWLAKAAP